MKKKSCIIMWLIVAVSMIFAGACADKTVPGTDNGKDKESFIEVRGIPGAEGLSVDVTERPEGFSIGDYSFNAVFIDNVELDSRDYVVRNGRFMFAYDYYGAIGVGDYTVRLVFEEDAVEYPLKITDKKAPLYHYELPSTAVFDIENEIVLPVVERLNDYQDYNVRYLIYKGSETGELIYNKTDVEKTNDSITYGVGALGMGDYVYKVQIRKASQTIKEYVCNFSVVKYANDIFSEENFANWKMVSTAITKNFEDGVVNFVPRDTNGLNGRYFVAYYSVNFLREAQLKGCETFTFEYKVNEEMSETPNNGGDNRGGLRIFAKVNDGFDGNALSGIVTDSEAGLYKYSDHTELPTEWIKVTINISEFLGLSPDVNFIGIVVSGQTGSVASFRNATFA